MTPPMDYESQLVGPGKKYADLQALEASRLEADRFIDQLQDEQDRLRNELDQRLSYEEFMTRYESSQNRRNEPRPDNQPETEDTREKDTAKLTPQDVERIVEQHETRKRFEQNRNSTMSQYAAVNGPNHAQKLEQQATELGMSKESLMQIAATNPKAFNKLVGIEEQRKPEGFTVPPRSQMNTEGFTPTSSNKKNFDYYENLRKTNSHEYWQPRVQNEMFKLLSEQGDDFYK